MIAIHVRVFVVGFAALACLTAAGCDGKNPTAPIPPAPIPTISITPTELLQLEVGQQVKVSAVASGMTTNRVTYSSSVPTVATVDSDTGDVRCVGAGMTTILAISVEQPSLRVGVILTCVGTAQEFLSVNGGPFTFAHVVGTTGCPQRVGIIRITNVGNVPVDLTVSAGNTAVRLDNTGFTLAAGTSRDVAVEFNCTIQTSFTTTVIVSGRSGTAAETKTVQVIGHITR